MKDPILHIPSKISFSKDIVNYFPLAIREKLPQEIAVIAVSPQKSLQLNQRYRNKRKPANVLSFLYPALSSYARKSPIQRQSSIDGSKHHIIRQRKGGVYGRDYGEIIVCPEIISKDARKHGNTQVFQMTWMIVHGMLHLAGMHHEKSRMMARRVDHLEKKILVKMDI